MKISVISGKGGTGKTTLTASLAYLVDKEFSKADCDVDASNLDLMLNGRLIEKTPYIGAKLAVIDQDKCIACGDCKEVCRYDAIEFTDGTYKIKPLKCEGCNACVVKCKVNAVRLNDEVIGDIQQKDFENGLLVTSNMIPGAEGSGKLVHEIRKKASQFSESILIDGSPGTSCAVMSSITDTDIALIVTEPTKSGLEDLLRIQQVVKHFKVFPYIIINKYDININMTNKIIKEANALNIDVIGKIPFDEKANEAINTLTPLIKFNHSKAAKEIHNIWTILKKEMNNFEENKMITL
jgi:MinD superfamily P-loop ATPase